MSFAFNRGRGVGSKFFFEQSIPAKFVLGTFSLQLGYKRFYPVAPLPPPYFDYVIYEQPLIQGVPQKTIQTSELVAPKFVQFFLGHPVDVYRDQTNRTMLYTNPYVTNRCRSYLEHSLSSIALDIVSVDDYLDDSVPDLIKTTHLG